MTCVVIDKKLLPSDFRAQLYLAVVDRHGYSLPRQPIAHRQARVDYIATFDTSAIGARLYDRVEGGEPLLEMRFISGVTIYLFVGDILRMEICWP